MAFIHRDRNYGVSFPDFPGCVSVGEASRKRFASEAKRWRMTRSAFLATAARREIEAT